MKTNLIKTGISFLLILMLLFVMHPAPFAASSITLKSSSTSVNYDAQTLTINRPSSVITGDLLLAQITYEKGLDAWPVMPPSGWTKVIVTNAYSGGGYKDIGQAVYYKVAQANEPAAYTWQFAQKVEALGGITAFSGVYTTDPIDSYSGLGGYGDSTGKNMLNAPGITVSGQSKIIAFYGFKENAVLDVPFGMSLLYQKRDDDNDYTILAAEESVLSASQTGIRTSYSWEYDDPNESVESEWAAQLIALRPSSGTAQPIPQPTTQIISVYINDKLLTMSEQPFIENDRALIPMRAFFEALDAAVSWDPVTRTAIGIRGGITVRVVIDSTSPTVNGISKTIDVPARIINGRTYIPLRFVGEAFGDNVYWHGFSKTIYITKK